jgi:hypothetical protein
MAPRDHNWSFRHRDTSQTGQETRDNAETQVTDEVDRGNMIDWLVDKFNHGQRVQDTYTQDMNSQARELAQGVDTREGPIMQCYNYLSTPHPRLKQMVTEDVDPDGVGSTGDQWIDAGNAMVRFQEGVRSAIDNSQADWKGKAGNSARSFMASVGGWVGEAGQSAQLAGTQTNLQAVALSDAKRNMPEPVDFDLDAANQDLQSTTNPMLYLAKLGTYQTQYNNQQAAHEQAAGVVSTYDNSLASASTMPAFGAPPQMTGGGSQTKVQKSEINDSTNDVSTNNVSTNGSNDGQQTNQPPNGQIRTPPTSHNDQGGSDGSGNGGGKDDHPGNQDIPGGSNNGGGSGGGSGNGSGNGPGSGLPPGNGTGTTPSSDVPPGGGLPGQFPTPGTSGGNNPGQNPNLGTPLPIGGLPGPTGGDIERGTGRGFGPGGGRGFGPGGGYGGYGPGESGPGGRAGGPGTMGRGPGAGGMGPGGALAAEGAVGGRGAAGGRGGAGGMMPHGKRGEGEEDGEHQRASYLVEGDPDAVFGTDEMTAPPVIGE